MTKRKHDLQTILDAIKGEGYWASNDPKKLTTSFGNMMTIAARLGVSRGTVYNYAKDLATVREAIDEARELRKDYVEDKMLKRIMDGSDTMMIFFAKTQMKDRGYVERQELTGAEGVPLLDPAADKALKAAYGNNGDNGTE